MSKDLHPTVVTCVGSDSKKYCQCACSKISQAYSINNTHSIKAKETGKEKDKT